MPRGQMTKVVLPPVSQESASAVKWLIVLVAVGAIVAEVYFGFPILRGKKEMWLWFGAVHVPSAAAAFFLFKKQFRKEMEETASVVVFVFVCLIGGSFSFLIAAGLSDGRFKMLSDLGSKKKKNKG